MNSIPILVLLHGTRLTGAQWTGYAERLADVAEVRSPDLPGHGQRAHQAFTLAAAVQAVESVVAAAGERPVLLAGHSLGGFVAMSYAEQHPTRLGGLALMGSATEPGGPGAGVYRLLARLWALAGPARMQRLDARVLGRLLDTRIWAAIQAEGEYFGAVDAAWSEVMRHCGSHQLRHVACPVLVLGGRWDQLHLQARRFARAAPRGTVVTVPGRGHFWPMTHPGEVATQLRRWIAAVQPRSEPHSAPTIEAKTTARAAPEGARNHEI